MKRTEIGGCIKLSQWQCYVLMVPEILMLLSGILRGIFASCLLLCRGKKWSHSSREWKSNKKIKLDKISLNYEEEYRGDDLRGRCPFGESSFIRFWFNLLKLGWQCPFKMLCGTSSSTPVDGPWQKAVHLVLSVVRGMNFKFCSVFHLLPYFGPIWQLMSAK